MNAQRKSSVAGHQNKYRRNFPLGYAEEADQRLQKIKKFLSQIKNQQFIVNSEITEFLSQEIRGAACVAASGELERYFREVLKFIYDTILNEDISIEEIQPGLQVVNNSSNFQILANQDLGLKNWDTRYKLLSSHNSQDRFIYRPSARNPVQPLDGKTIKKEHVSTIIQALNLNYSPKAKQLVSITAISNIRNDVAHLNVPITEIFHQGNSEKSISVIIEHLDNIIEFIIEISYAIEEYCANKKYLTN